MTTLLGAVYEFVLWRHNTRSLFVVLLKSLNVYDKRIHIITIT
jgi:hypothetical protein